MAFISRNPFARQELHSKKVFTPQDCGWCGQVKTDRDGHQYLYEYRVENDGGRKNVITGQFCCADCMRSYHNIDED
jgi:hypothetical protein